MKLFIEKTGESKEMDFSGTFAELLKVLDISAQDVLCVKNRQVVPESERVEKGDEVSLLSVVSGG